MNGPRARYHKIDGWRGYFIPGLAVAGSSDTGMADDSPAPTDKVKEEIERLRRFLREEGINTRVQLGETSNVFNAKRWIVVASPEEYARARQLTNEWLEDNNRETRYIHDAA